MPRMWQVLLGSIANGIPFGIELHAVDQNGNKCVFPAFPDPFFASGRLTPSETCRDLPKVTFACCWIKVRAGSAAGAGCNRACHYPS